MVGLWAFSLVLAKVGVGGAAVAVVLKTISSVLHRWKRPGAIPSSPAFDLHDKAYAWTSANAITGGQYRDHDKYEDSENEPCKRT